MRNQLVFDASHKAENRFELCNTVFTAIRKLHVKSGSIPDTINTALEFCSHVSTAEIAESA